MESTDTSQSIRPAASSAACTFDRSICRSAPGAAPADLSSEEWRILNAFEGERYELLEIALSTGELGWVRLVLSGVLVRHWGVFALASWLVEAFKFASEVVTQVGVEVAVVAHGADVKDGLTGQQISRSLQASHTRWGMLWQPSVHRWCR